MLPAATNPCNAVQKRLDFYKLESSELKMLFPDLTGVSTCEGKFYFDFDAGTKNDVWERQISFKFDEGKYRKQSVHQQNQKYYRYMEKYSQSLNSSKSLHHRIIRVATTSSNAGAGLSQQGEKKLSKKAEALINANKKATQDAKEGKEMRILTQFAAECKTCEQFELKLKVMDLSESTPVFKSSILKRKIVFYKYETSCNETKARLFLLIKELFEVYSSCLTESETREYLELLRRNGFKSTASHFKGILANKSAAAASSTDSESFRHDLMFQLLYLGDNLKRTLNSTPDKRVRFEPDDWQKDLLDSVDRKESALVVCPTSSGKTFICYYAIEQVLSSSDEDVIVFVAPIKALDNQVAAEVYARQVFIICA